jgi:hypothetical protein
MPIRSPASMLAGKESKNSVRPSSHGFSEMKPIVAHPPGRTWLSPVAARQFTTEGTKKHQDDQMEISYELPLQFFVSFSAVVVNFHKGED